MANGPTGRRVKEPIADLVEWVHEGISHTLVVFHEDFRDDDAFGSGIAPIRDFLDKPCVMGITGLAEQPSAPGVFAYKTGVVRTVRELISIMADGDGAGWKASLELFHRAGRALLDAAEAGTVSGITNHGSLSPWRLVVNAKGGVEVIGYGLPALDVVDWVREPVPDMRPAVGTVRYLAPERCEGNAEDISTDLFVLALICAELATGKPVYGGTAKTVAGDASEGIAESLLKAPPNIQALFGRALKPWPNERWSDTGDLLSQVQGVADDLDGLDLAAVYAECLDYDSDVEIKLPKDWSIQGLSGASESASDDEDIDALCERIFAEAPKVGKQVDASGSWLDSAIEALDASNTDVKTLIAETNGLANLGADAADRADAIANEAEEAATLDQAQALWDEVEELSARAGKIDAEIRGLISKGLAVQDAAAVEALRVAAEEEADRIAAEEAQGAAEEEAKRIAAEEETARLAAEEASRIAEEARIAAEQEAARIAAEEEEAARIAAEEAAKAAEEEARIAAEEEEARIAAEEEAARIADEEEAARIAAEEARIAAEEEAARIAEEEEAARIAAEEEARIAAEEEAARIAAEEEEEAARIAAEEEAARIAAEEAAQAAEEEAARIAAEEEAARIAAEEEEEAA
ncbi:MAG: hypothetical protein GWP91_12810, partial [Rhodobacterales bacterium]|nr:hypothetical protein [Rhodobacterales bacterium]